MSALYDSLRISGFPILFPFNILVIRFQVGCRCRHKFIIGNKLMPRILRFLRIFSVANISYFLIFSRLSLFLIRYGFGVKFVSLYNASFFALGVLLTHISFPRLSTG